MMFVVHPRVFDLFPGMRIAVAVAHDVEVPAVSPGIEGEWEEAWAGVAAHAQYGNPQSHPRVALWRERFKAMGVSGKDFPSSIEAMLRRALKGGAPFAINPLVDFYNAVSLRHVVPAGGFDLDELHGDLELRLTREGDQFTALDESKPLAVPPGEVAYACGSMLLTRHFAWRQARQALLTSSTRRLVLVAEVLGGIEARVADRVAQDFAAGLGTYFGAVATTGIVEADRPEISLDAAGE